eukprot:7156913-Prymnesium_polylepis.2
MLGNHACSTRVGRRDHGPRDDPSLPEFAAMTSSVSSKREGCGGQAARARRGGRGGWGGWGLGGNAPRRRGCLVAFVFRRSVRDRICGSTTRDILRTCARAPPPGGVPRARDSFSRISVDGTGCGPLKPPGYSF